jgi:hypothetical protein
MAIRRRELIACLLQKPVSTLSDLERRRASACASAACIRSAGSVRAILARRRMRKRTNASGDVKNGSPQTARRKQEIHSGFRFNE